MKYKNYYGSVEFSNEDSIFWGKIIGINDHITYEGDSVETLRNNFQEAVEDYFEICKEIGKEP